MPPRLALLALALLPSFAAAADAEKLRVPPILGVERTGTVYPPTKGKGKAPVVFLFHGHGGTGKKFAADFDMHSKDLWPESLVVAMQGLPIVSPTDPKGEKDGWQHNPGQEDDRDLKFFDAAWAAVQEKYKVDPARVYAAGHSNGGGFTYLLWQTRGDVFRAVAPSSAYRGENFLKRAKPKPALHVAGKKDELLDFAKQAEFMAGVRDLNGCDKKGRPYGPHATLYPSKGGTPFVAYVHDGGHKFPDDAPRAIVAFFKDQDVK